MNIPLLRKIQKQILKEPKLFDMRSWYQYKDCGTAHCIGGWVTHFTDKLDRASSLKITQYQANRLFYIGYMHDWHNVTNADQKWPKRFEKAYKQCKSDLARAKVAVRRIDHFIKTKGEE